MTFRGRAKLTASKFQALSIRSIWCCCLIDTKSFCGCNYLIISILLVGAEERIRYWHNRLPLIESTELFHGRMNTGYYRHSIRSRCSPVISLVLRRYRHQTDTMDRHQRMPLRPFHASARIHFASALPTPRHMISYESSLGRRGISGFDYTTK